MVLFFRFLTRLLINSSQNIHRTEILASQVIKNSEISVLVSAIISYPIPHNTPQPHPIHTKLLHKIMRKSSAIMNFLISLRFLILLISSYSLENVPFFHIFTVFHPRNFFQPFFLTFLQPFHFHFSFISFVVVRTRKTLFFLSFSGINKKIVKMND